MIKNYHPGISTLATIIIVVVFAGVATGAYFIGTKKNAPAAPEVVQEKPTPTQPKKTNDIPGSNELPQNVGFDADLLKKNVAFCNEALKTDPGYIEFVNNYSGGGNSGIAVPNGIFFNCLGKKMELNDDIYTYIQVNSDGATPPYLEAGDSIYLIGKPDWGISFRRNEYWKDIRIDKDQIILEQYMGDGKGDTITLRHSTGNEITTTDAKFGNTTLYFDTSAGK